MEKRIDHLRPTRSAKTPVGTSIRKMVKIMIDSIRLICTSVKPRASSKQRHGMHVEMEALAEVDEDDFVDVAGQHSVDANDF